MRPLLKTIDTICGIGAGLAALACAGLAVMLIIEVVATSYFSYSQPWAVEYSGYLLAAVLFSGAGWTLGQGGHIRVALLIQALGPRGARLVDLGVSLFALGVVVFVTWAVVQNALRSVELGSVSYYPSRTPIWIPQAVLAFGWIVLCLGFVARILRLILGEPPDRTAQAEAPS